MNPNSDKFPATRFLFLTPKNIGFHQLFRVLLSTTKLHTENFVECHQVVEEESFDEYKCLIFISLLLQKFMQLFKYPLKYLGFIVELFLNLASGNYNIFQIILNFFQGCYQLSNWSNFNVFFIFFTFGSFSYLLVRFCSCQFFNL
jgi:hypothetical protein